MHVTRSIILWTGLLASVPASGHAQERTGIGIVVGEPTGISAKWRLREENAFDAAAAWSFGGRKDALQLHVDYLRHRYGMFRPDRGKLPWYYGIGGRVVFGDKAVLGIRIPLGLAYEFAADPIDLFIEIVPVLDLAPSTDFHLNGAIGGRFWF